MPTDNRQNIIIYNTADGKASVALFAKDGMVWMNQNQIAELFATSVPNISMHISNILNEQELDGFSVVKDYLTTASDGKGNGQSYDQACIYKSRKGAETQRMLNHHIFASLAPLREKEINLNRKMKNTQNLKKEIICRIS